MTGTEGIQIYVACHKPTWVLDNRLLVPVQVGAALTDARYAGMRQDNEGEHISEKNAQYCELTAQYWAWKIQTVSITAFSTTAGICPLQKFTR